MWIRDSYTDEERKDYFGQNGHPKVLTKKECWWQMIQLLPSSYNQTRNYTFTYENLINMYFARRNHKLDEWRIFCQWMLDNVPYFKELVDFVEEIKFNRLGVFTYSDEEDTKGYLMEPKVSETTMKKRLNAIMQIQNGISNKLNHEYIGKTYSAIIDSYDSQANKYIVLSLIHI